MPPLGAVSVATCVREFTDFEVEVVDENNYKSQIDHRAIQAERPADFVGFYGGLTSTVPRLYDVARQYKDMGAVTIAGGVHMHAMPDEALDSGIDYVVDGEGEHCLPELLEALVAAEAPDTIRGLTFRQDGQTVRTGQRPPITDLDALPAPDFSLMVNIKRKVRFVPISRTRGCNFACEFCSVKQHLGPCRSGSPETAYRQIVEHVKNGRKMFFVVDDNFVQDKEGAKELCRLLIDYRARSGKKLDIVVQVRADAARDHEMLYLMKEAGVTTLCIGYESPIDEELKMMKKGITVRKLEEHTRVLRDYGFLIHGMFIFGYPTFEGTGARSTMSLKQRAEIYLDFIKRTRIDTIQVMKPVPLPGTVLRQRLEAENRIFPQSLVGWDKYDGNWLCFQPDEGYSATDLQNYATWIMRKVYHPMQIVKFLYLIPNYPIDLAFYSAIEAWRGARKFFSENSPSTLLRRSLPHHARAAVGFSRATIANAREVVGKRLRNAKLKSAGALIYDSWKRKFRKERFYEVLEAATRRLKGDKTPQ
ncbi:MAG: radical SAM protein [Planctomycetes bacterium]|nr:radical SAM protein [Planctomycetota bacterium]